MYKNHKLTPLTLTTHNSTASTSAGSLTHSSQKKDFFSHEKRSSISNEPNAQFPLQNVYRLILDIKDLFDHKKILAERELDELLKIFEKIAKTSNVSFEEFMNDPVTKKKSPHIAEMFKTGNNPNQGVIYNENFIEPEAVYNEIKNFCHLSENMDNSNKLENSLIPTKKRTEKEEEEYEEKRNQVENELLNDFNLESESDFNSEEDEEEEEYKVIETRDNRNVPKIAKNPYSIKDLK